MFYVGISCIVFFFKQKTAYEMRISDWSSDVCSSDLSFDRSTYYYITLGGLSIGPDATVIDRRGDAVKGLFAAGACTAHLSPDGKSYASGMSLGPGSFFGRVAGRSAMAAAAG